MEKPKTVAATMTETEMLSHKTGTSWFIGLVVVAGLFCGAVILFILNGSGEL